MQNIIKNSVRQIHVINSGQEILEKVSAQAWNDWMNFQTILINENRLNLMDEKAREFLAEKRNKYFLNRRTGSHLNNL